MLTLLKLAEERGRGYISFSLNVQTLTKVDSEIGERSIQYICPKAPEI